MSRLLAQAIALAYFAALTGCSGGGATDVRYYVIDPVAASNALSMPEQPLAIEIIDLQVPQYMERAHRVA